jgi:catechol 2,3-dioxygenase-like lactoylglutathione lyase family enzyme
MSVDTKLEVVAIPVSDVDRAKHFYESLGWRLDADLAWDGFRVVQVTPPGSQCSVIFGSGVAATAPGPVEGLVLVVDDIAAVRAELAAHGAAPSEIFHDGFLLNDGKGRLPGPDPEHRSYRTWASFHDPDGNGWVLQEITTRLPGRVTTYEAVSDAATLAELLRETEQRHGEYEATAPKHHWSAWYAAYIVAREHGRTPDEAASDAAHHMERAR